MSDEKNQDGVVDEGAAQRLAEQRKALNLQTRPLEVIADLDWGVDDEEDFVFTPPTVAAPAPAPAPEVAPVVETPAAAAPVAVSSGGTMMMSLGDFNAALQEETAQIAENAQQSAVPAAKEAPAPQEQAQVAQQPAVRGGTMLLSGAAVLDAMGAAQAEAEEPDANSKQTLPNESVSGAEEIADIAPHQSPSGTMLMSSAAIHAQLEQEADVRSSQQIALEQQATTAAHEAVAQVAHQPVEPQAPAWDKEPQRETASWANPADAHPTAAQNALPAARSNKTTIILIAVALLVLAGLLYVVLG